MFQLSNMTKKQFWVSMIVFAILIIFFIEVVFCPPPVLVEKIDCWQNYGYWTLDKIPMKCLKYFL